MSTSEIEGDIGPPEPENEKGALAGADLRGLTNTPRRLSILAEAVKQELGEGQGFCLHERIIRPAVERSMRWIGETPHVRSACEEEMFARKLVRKETAIELRVARKRLAQLKQEIHALRVRAFDYPNPPPAMAVLTPNGLGIPSSSGIYFVWSGETIVYVGQSIDLGKRVRRGHHAINRVETVSWVLVPAYMLDYAECFYIGTLRPQRNFGVRAKWRALQYES
jgi:hypothetical protein